MEKIQETLRFVRLAETRKNLDFSDEKLLDLNEILDEYEANQLKLKQRQRRLKMRLNEGPADKAQLIDEYFAVKVSVHENEMAMWKKVRELLTPDETIEFFTFYQEFQRKVQQRARQLNRPNQRNPRNNRFRN
ncbi:hypothetical protein [Acanthopleuribacter pedis]|uniref:Uncharacterized protein n=1 Tax=Acanthopleuribacter pedis TaxID=442870 RepID=A0A8J7U4V2_9BACT|nr:hypothetical protein [Acanthopleuribacter pedis]MBO1320174.1 hypothetical protein [Acanthopleuribacter pedis]